MVPGYDHCAVVFFGIISNTRFVVIFASFTIAILYFVFAFVLFSPKQTDDESFRPRQAS